MTGSKRDEGKIQANILFEQFPKALKAVAQVATFGSAKYSRHNWNQVENAEERYGDALVRHQIEKYIEVYDNETGYLHAAHMAWNALVCLQLEIERRESEGTSQVDSTETIPTELPVAEGVPREEASQTPPVAEVDVVERAKEEAAKAAEAYQDERFKISVQRILKKRYELLTQLANR